MNIGDRVSHTQLGVGIVKKLNIYHGDTRALVDFGYTEEFILVSHLKLVESSSTSSESTPPTPAQKPIAPDRTKEVSRSSQMPDETVEARKGIVALRLGQVLESHVAQLSVATDVAEKQLRDSLNQAVNNHPAMIMVVGAWGGGKTHLLTLLAAIAREQKLAIANVVMDGVGVTLSDPMQLMESVTSSLRFPDETLAGGLGAYLVHANTQSLRVKGAHLLADALERVPSQVVQEPEVLQILEDYFGLTLSASQAGAKLRQLGHPTIKLPSLRVRGVDDRPERFCDLLGNWAQFTVSMGARGLVVVLDELDVEYAKFAWRDRSSIEKRRRRNILIRELGKLRKKKFPLLVAFASAPAAPDVAVENDAVNNIDTVIGRLDYRIQVPVPQDEDIRTLGRNVMQLYLNAYPDLVGKMSDKQQQQMLNELVEMFHKELSPVPRFFVRSMIEILDIESNGTAAL